MSVPTGYYKRLISDSNIRIAFTHTPIHGCTIVNNSQTLKELKESNDEHSKFYIDGLESGRMVTIVENSVVDRYYRMGELYFNS